MDKLGFGAWDFGFAWLKGFNLENCGMNFMITFIIFVGK